MRQHLISTLIIAAVLFLFAQGIAYGEMMEGIVTDIKSWQNTFQMTTRETAADMQKETLFVVRPDTQMKGAPWLRDLDVGDRLAVTGEPMNEILWKAYSLEKRP